MTDFDMLIYDVTQFPKYLRKVAEDVLHEMCKRERRSVHGYSSELYPKGCTLSRTDDASDVLRSDVESIVSDWKDEIKDDPLMRDLYRRSVKERRDYETFDDYVEHNSYGQAKYQIDVELVADSLYRGQARGLNVTATFYVNGIYNGSSEEISSIQVYEETIDFDDDMIDVSETNELPYDLEIDFRHMISDVYNLNK